VVSVAGQVCSRLKQAGGAHELVAALVEQPLQIRSR
jgi:hypothetical protein